MKLLVLLDNYYYLLVYNYILYNKKYLVSSFNTYELRYEWNECNIWERKIKKMIDILLVMWVLHSPNF